MDTALELGSGRGWNFKMHSRNMDIQGDSEAVSNGNDTGYWKLGERQLL